MAKEKTCLYGAAMSSVLLPAWAGGCTGSCGACSGSCMFFLLTAGGMGLKIIYTRSHQKTGGDVLELL